MKEEIKREDIRRAVLETPEKSLMQLQTVHEISLLELRTHRGIQEDIYNWLIISIAKGLIENDLVQINKENLRNGTVHYEASLWVIDFKNIHKEGGEK